MPASDDGRRVDVEIDGRTLRLSNLEKVLWPEARVTKRYLIDYYRAVAPALLPHIAGRPVTLARFPDGVEGPGWYQQNCPPGRPEWLPLAPVPGRGGRPLRYCVINDVASLVWLANLATIEVHPLLAGADRPDVPRALVLDLDPGAPAGILDCCKLALAIRDALAVLGLRCFAKTSGAKGLHVFAPLDGTQTFRETKAFARAMARALAARDPARVVDRMPRSERTGKVFVDWGQNDPAKSTVSPYSLRATRHPLVSTPLRWEEVEHAVESGDVWLLLFGPAEVLARLDRHGDLFRPVLDLEQRLPVDAAGRMTASLV